MPAQYGIDGELAAHDRNQFELKLDYSLEPNKRRNKYDVELYLFFPRSLHVNNLTYSKRLFYSDIQGYIRFKTPPFTLAELADPENALAPLTRIDNFLTSGASREDLIAELKLHTCIMRVALRDKLAKLRGRLKLGESEGAAEEIRTACENLSRCLERFRALKERLAAPYIHEDVRLAFRHADEYAGITVDGQLNAFNNAIATLVADGRSREALAAPVRRVILDEFEYRKQHGYATYTAKSENDAFLHRKSFLKKIITSVLFLKTYTEEGATYMRDMIFAAAAGIAMVLATVITIWANINFGTHSISFVLAVVIGYMMKDRIKDWCKFIFSNRMSHWLVDYKTAIVDQMSGKKIGVCRHAFSFVSEKNVPPDVMKLRRSQISKEFLTAEDIIKYEKEIVLKPSPILRKHIRLRDVTDIIRFNVQRFLGRMDEPSVVRRAIDPSSGQTTDFTFVHDYHINAVFRLGDQVRKVRLVLNRDGIKRTEELDPS